MTKAKAARRRAIASKTTGYLKLIQTAAVLSSQHDTLVEYGFGVQFLDQLEFDLRSIAERLRTRKMTTSDQKAGGTRVRSSQHE